MIKIGVIGYGYWGPNLVRNFAETPGVAVAAVADLDTAKLEIVQRRYPGGQDHDRLPGPAARSVDRRYRDRHAGQHAFRARHGGAQGRQAPVARKADGRDVAAGAEADRRSGAAQARSCSSTTRSSTPARSARWARSSSSGELGRVYYYDSVRVNLGLFQRDVSVISDLAVHDFSILDYLLGEHPIAVSASGTNHFPGTPENLAYITLFYPIRDHRPCQRELARAGQGAADPDRRQQEDDHLRRSRAEREDQGLRQGNQLHRRPASRSTRCASAIGPATCGRRSST